MVESESTPIMIKPIDIPINNEFKLKLKDLNVDWIVEILKKYHP